MSKRIGKFGETLATNYLLDNKYIVLDKNYTSRYGEIDIVAQKEDCYIMVEVKTRSSIKYGTIHSVTNDKLLKIEKTAYCYFMEHNIDNPNFRIDVIYLFLSNGNYKLDHIENVTL